MILTLLCQVRIAALSSCRSRQGTCFRDLHGPKQVVTQTHRHATETWHAWSPEECMQLSSETLISPAASQIQEIDVQVGMHLGCLLACNTVSAMWLTVSLVQTFGMNCLLKIGCAAMSSHDSFTVCKAAAQARYNECISSIYQKHNTCFVQNCMAYNATNSPPEDPVYAAGAGPAVPPTPAPQLETGQPATGKTF